MHRLSDSDELTEHDLEQVAGGGGTMGVKKDAAAGAAPPDSPPPSSGASKKKDLIGGEGVEAAEAKLAPAGDGDKKKSA